MAALGVIALRLRCSLSQELTYTERVLTCHDSYIPRATLLCRVTTPLTLGRLGDYYTNGSGTKALGTVNSFNTRATLKPQFPSSQDRQLADLCAQCCLQGMCVQHCFGITSAMLGVPNDLNLGHGPFYICFLSPGTDHHSGRRLPVVSRGAPKTALQSFPVA